MDTAEIGKRTRQENRRLTWLAVKQNKASYLMIAPFMLFFLVFTIVPVVMSLPMGFTDFNMVQMPKFVGLSNYTTLFLSDKVFIQSIRVTLVFALFTGPISYVLCFLLAWLINELHPKLRTIFTLIFYAPSMANVYTVWKLIFSGDSYGYLNSFLLDLGIISSPIQWLTDGSYVLGVTIVVQMWISLGAGFLALRAGFQNIDRSQYEAGAIEGIKSRWQELIYITIPSMKPQMLFGAVMAIVSAFQQGGIGVQLSGTNPTPGYAGQLMVNHAEDFGFIRYEMGYASAVSVVLLVMIYAFSKIAQQVFREKGEG